MSKVKCLMCNITLESKSIHDFKRCNCPNSTFVDGGNEGARYGGVKLDLVKVL